MLCDIFMYSTQLQLSSINYSSYSAVRHIFRILAGQCWLVKDLVVSTANTARVAIDAYDVCGAVSRRETRERQELSRQRLGVNVFGALEANNLCGNWERCVIISAENSWQWVFTNYYERLYQEVIILFMNCQNY